MEQEQELCLQKEPSKALNASASSGQVCFDNFQVNGPYLKGMTACEGESSAGALIIILPEASCVLEQSEIS